jgi:hypothetical protein
MSGKYDDIINLPHPTSKRFSRMPLEERAAQFSPFAALTGYDAVIRETARLTGRRVEPDECRRQELDAALRDLAARLDSRPEVLVTYFLEDTRKEGGEYVHVSGRLKKIDSFSRVLVLEDGTIIPIDDVLELS